MRFSDSSIVYSPTIRLLIRTSVFNHIPKPWFEFKPTEDFYFCDKARYSGYKVFMDTRVRCNHHYYGCREAR